MFMGRYEHSVDEKGRMSFPARFRDSLEGGAYLTLGFDRNLVVYTSSYLKHISDKVALMSNTDPNVRLLRRLLYSDAAMLEFDASGRILIPQHLREPVEITNSAVVIGAGDYIEIWAPQIWATQSSLLDDPEKNIQRFASLNM
jgi:MraZ protein